MPEQNIRAAISTTSCSLRDRPSRPLFGGLFFFVMPAVMRKTAMMMWYCKEPANGGFC
jgi:hypothetical protein